MGTDKHTHTNERQEWHESQKLETEKEEEQNKSQKLI